MTTKEKTLMPFPWTLDYAVEFIITGVDGTTSQEKIESINQSKNVFSFPTFDGWIRNHCGLWEDGGMTKIIDEIRKSHLSGRYVTHSLYQNIVTDPYITYFDINLVNKDKNPDIDYTLSHPDNCSQVLLEIVMIELENRMHGTA